MPVPNNHINYTAADIARYHRGDMPAAEMHALEKAALEDPFLADALEGYTVAGAQAETDMDLLRKKLAVRTGEDKNEKAPVIALSGAGFRWWKVAAMIILVAGAALLAYQFGFNNNSSDQVIAQKETKEDSPATRQTGTAEADADVTNEDQAVTTNTKAPRKTDGSAVRDNSAGPQKITGAEPEGRKEPTTPAAPAVQDIASEMAQGNAKVIEKKAEASLLQAHEQDGYKRQPAARLKAQPDRNVFKNSHVFRGRVTDQQNNALPFANIVNEADNVGTYTDARGYFTLTSPDSVLNVQVRSIGFEDNRAVLSNQAATNQVMLQEDKSLEEVVVSRSRANTNRARNASMVLEEPEPADGWQNYDTYIANNLQVPEGFQRQRSRDITGVVELSFEVDASGNPINIRVEKSLCESCDKEAIRLLKDGPKWKRKARKNGRTTLTIPF